MKELLEGSISMAELALRTGYSASSIRGAVTYRSPWARGPEQIVDDVPLGDGRHRLYYFDVEDPHLEESEIDIASDDDLERVCERCGYGSVWVLRRALGRGVHQARRVTIIASACWMTRGAYEYWLVYWYDPAERDIKSAVAYYRPKPRAEEVI